MPKVGTEPIRREQILDATLETIAQRGLEATRMRQIAANAGLSQPSLHYYFNTKDQLIVQLLERLLTEFLRGRNELLRAAEGSMPKLRVLLDQQKRIITEDKDRLEVYYDFWVQATKRPLVRKKIAEMYEHWRRDIEQIIGEGVKQGTFRADRASQAPFMLVSLFQGAALQSIIDRPRFDLDAYFAQVEDLIVNYLGTGT
ncbi:MAG TPA: TetR family transcriptional regulator [Anaerolineae bacterium]|nr:TetR family transcriptional regulator [Anaerolineae bacterium]